MYKHIFKTMFAITLSFAIATATPATESMTQTETLAEAGLAGFETLWIPARYRDDQRNALFIKGRQFTAPGGYTDVAGYLPTERGYLVAVYQATQPIDVSFIPASSESLSVVFYEAAKDGNVGPALGTIPDAEYAVVGKTGIFVAQQTAKGIYGYSGYDTNGKLVAGPQGVRFASPAPDGGWFVQKVVSEKPNHVDIVTMRYGTDGAAKVLAKDAIHEQEFNRFGNSTAVFVDQPPLADSARTGHVVRLYREYSSMSRDFRELRGCVTDLNETKGRTLGAWCVKIGNAHGTTLGTAADLTRRIIVFGNESSARAASQLSPKGFGPAVYGTVDLKATETYKTEKEVFRIAGAGSNFARTLFGGNNSNLTANSRNDAYGIITPKGNLLVLANEHLSGSPRQAVNLVSGKTLDSEDIEGFLFQYGITR